jgi:hypothetical protein
MNLIRTAREYAVQVDGHGIDPLRDKQIPEIQKIYLYSDYVVGQHERGALDLISINHYGSNQWWWHIMVYNSITRFSQVVQGLKLKMPDISSLQKLGASSSESNPSSKLVDRLVSI